MEVRGKGCSYAVPCECSLAGLGTYAHMHKPHLYMPGVGSGTPSAVQGNEGGGQKSSLFPECGAAAAVAWHDTARHGMA
jgi:hypothetical protein